MLNENRLYKLLKTCMDPQTDLKNLVKSSSEFLRRVEQSSPGIVPTMTAFLRRSSLRIVNQSSIPTLVRRVQKASEGSPQVDAARSAEHWMTFISKHQPALYKLHVGELAKAIADERNVKLVEVSLQALAATVQWDPKLAPTEKRTHERVMRYVMESNYRHAKFAARLLTRSQDSEAVCADIIESIADSLPTADAELLAAHTAVLAQLALKAPEAFEVKSDVIMKFLLKQILMRTEDASDDMDVDTEWIEDADMAPLLRAKIFALKTCRNRCLAHSKDEEVLEIAKPVLNMFATIIRHSGSFTADANDDPKDKARLRLQAAVSSLHLAGVKDLLMEVQTNFVPLAITIQDPCYQIRMTFLDKAISLLSSSKLNPAYNVLPFLSVHDPEADVILKARAYVGYAARSMPKNERLARFEMIFFRLLHLLAHHPDFGTAEDTLPDIARYIEFYLELVASPDNIPLLFHLAMKAKTVRDIESHLYSENLYAISDLAQHLIKVYAGKHSWSVESYPGRVKLPGDIVRPLPSAEAANEIIKTVYLPESSLACLHRGTEVKAKSRAEPVERKPPTKRKAAPKTNGNTKRARTKGKRRKADTSEEESSSADEHEADEEDGFAPSSSDEVEDTVQENGSPPKEERLGRGARTRAKARIKKQVKTSRTKAKSPETDD